MLSDRERHALQDVERHLAVDDPTFVRTFETAARRLHSIRHRRAASTALAVALLFGTLVLLAGSAVGALAVAATTGLVWLMWRTCPEGEAGRAP